MEENIVSSVNAESVANVEPQQTEQVKTEPSVEKVEVAEQPKVEKPVQSAEDNAKFAAIRREAESKAKDAMIAEMYGESHGIYTYADYQKAVAAQREQEKLQELIEKKGVPEDVAKELLESKKFREQYENDKKTKSQEETRQKDFQSFIEAYPDIKGEEIPAEVWEENAKGKSLVDAYAKYENKMLKQKIAEFEKGKKAAEVNETNAASTTGSVTGQGSVPNGYFTQEQVKGMSQTEVNKNYSQIMESMKHWK